MLKTDLGLFADLLPGAITHVGEIFGETVLEIDPASARGGFSVLKDKLAFNCLIDVTALDGLGLNLESNSQTRFTVVYHLLSLPGGQRLRVKVPLEGNEPETDSVADLWPAANWAEREVYDLFGIRFRGHPDLRRIMLPESWDGHPLRKDYPLQGFPGQREPGPWEV